MSRASGLACTLALLACAKPRAQTSYPTLPPSPRTVPLPSGPATGPLPIGGGLPFRPGGAGRVALPAGDFWSRLRGRPGARWPVGQAGAQDLSRWPSWLELGGPGKKVVTGPGIAFKPRAGRGLLARLADRVLVRPAGEDASYPLAFWDKLRVLAPGAGVTVRSGGHALCVFSDGTELRLRRRGELVVVAADPDRLVLRVDDLSELRARLGSRRVELRLADGSVVTGSGASLRIDRLSRSAPWAASGVEDRLLLRNWGPAALRILPAADLRRAGAGEVVELGQNRRVILALRSRPSTAARAEPLALPVVLEGGGVPLRTSVEAVARTDGGLLHVRASGARARLAWGTLRLTLRAGAELVLDPLGGDPFGDARSRVEPEQPAEKKQR